MKAKKLQILVPQYKETDEVIKPLLESIKLQQNVNFDEIGVIIVNDGSDTFLSKELLESYPYEIIYHKNEHSGVSATRNKCLELATADYVMWCDADDMFYNMCGLWIVLNEAEHSHFDTMVSHFVEETRMPNGSVMYTNHEVDSTFVHGKVHRRQYLLDNDLKFNPKLTIHEDSYFNVLVQSCTENAVYCGNPFYLWKWRADSVCRHDPKYILKTYINLLDSSTELVHQLTDRKLGDKAKAIATQIIIECWLTMNTKEFLEQENQEYRRNTELRFKTYYNEFKTMFNAIDEYTKNQIAMGVRNRYYQQGLTFEEITFKDWIKHIETI